VLIGDIRAAIDAGVADGCGIRPGQNTWEVDVLVGLFRTTLPQLDAAFRTATAGTGLTSRLGGIFCHQSPKLTFGPYDTCEIGDLLIALKYQTTGAPLYRALLLQTKKADGKPIGPGDTQYELYLRWPMFEWVGTQEVRAVTNPRPHRGAQVGFLEVCDNACLECNVTTMALGEAPRPLADELFDLFNRGTGREFFAEPVLRPGDIDWSRVVWDLLRFTVGSVVFTWRRANVAGRSREFGLTGIFLTRQSLDPRTFFAGALSPGELDDLSDAWEAEGFDPPDGPFDPTFSDRGEDERPGGVSTILIDIGLDLEEGEWYA
jgi:hypothetical protein